MAKNSKISWTDHTFNPWMGCTKVSTGCQNCYAETLMDKRFGNVQWGTEGTRIKTSRQYWKQPLKWASVKFAKCYACNNRGPENEVKSAEGRCLYCESVQVYPTKQRVLCGSLCDVFEAKPNQSEDIAGWLFELFKLIHMTPRLNWMLLTKRPENIMKSLPAWWTTITDVPSIYNKGTIPSNVAFGTSVENQETANERIPELLKIPASTLFVSAEPLLEPINLTEAFSYDIGELGHIPDWLIIGGETGPGCRPMDNQWASSLIEEANFYGIPSYVKQLGGHPDKRENVQNMPTNLRIRELPYVAPY